MPRPLKALRALVNAVGDQIDDDPTWNAARDAIGELETQAAVAAAGLRAGVDPRALADLVRRGRDVFRSEGGRILPKQRRYSRYRPAEPLSVDEWASELRAEAPHLFTRRR